MLVATTNRYVPAAQFRAALRSFLRKSEDIARAAGLTPRQHLLLLQIAGSPAGRTTVSELVEKLALTQSAVTELVQRANLYDNVGIPFGFGTLVTGAPGTAGVPEEVVNDNFAGSSGAPIHFRGD